MFRMRTLAVLLFTFLLFQGLPGSAAPTISQGGLYDVGRNQIVVTQGLTGGVLVAGKQTLFRLYVPAGVDAFRIKRVNYRIRGSRGVVRRLTISGSQLIRYIASSGEDTVGVVIPGTMFPTSDTYTLDFSVTDQGGVTELFRVDEQAFQFQPTKDLRLHVVMIIRDGLYNADQTWYADLERSLRRLGSMLPVRDGVGWLNGDTSSGIRYTVSECNDGPAAECSFGKTRAINNGPGDDIDITVAFRPGFYDTDPPGDPYPGGDSRRPQPPYNDLPRAACVAGKWYDIGVEMTAPCFAHEIGHNLGLEPPSSPHYDPTDPGHSKEWQVDDPLAFDFLHLVSFTHRPDRPLGDVMGRGMHYGADGVSYNTFDWNFLRERLMTLSSTGSDTHPRSTLCVPDNPLLCAGRCSGTVVNSCGETVRCNAPCNGGKTCGPNGTCENPTCPRNPPICCTKPSLPVCGGFPAELTEP